MIFVILQNPRNKNVKYILRNIFLTLEIFNMSEMNMRKNKIGYFGVLGFLGLLGLTGNLGFYGFFGFFAFFSAFEGKGSDERVERNINRACRNAFIFITITSALSLAYIAAFKTVEAWPLALSLPLIAIILFAIFYIYYDRRGD